MDHRWQQLRRRWLHRGSGFPQYRFDILSTKSRLDEFGAVVTIPEAADAEEIGGVVEPAIDLPADQILASRRSVVGALRRPHDPAPALSFHEQRQERTPVRVTIPADGA